MHSCIHLTLGSYDHKSSKRLDLVCIWSFDEFSSLYLRFLNIKPISHLTMVYYHQNPIRRTLGLTISFLLFFILIFLSLFFYFHLHSNWFRLGSIAYWLFIWAYWIGFELLFSLVMCIINVGLLIDVNFGPTMWVRFIEWLKSLIWTWPIWTI